MRQHHDSASDDGDPLHGDRHAHRRARRGTRRKVIGMFGALGSWVYRRRRLVLLGWLVLFVVGIVVGGAVFGQSQGLQRGWLLGVGAGVEHSRQGQRHGPERGGRGGRQAGRRPGHPRGGAGGEPKAVRAAAVVERRNAYSTPDPRLRATDGSASLIVITVRKTTDMPMTGHSPGARRSGLAARRGARARP